MKKGDLIKKVSLNEGRHRIELNNIFPIGDIKGSVQDVKYYIKNELNQDSYYADTLEITMAKPGDIDIHLGLGYIAQPQPKWDEKFKRNDQWSGGDGIYSFNLTNGKDRFDLDEEVETLLVFGDTFVGRSDPKTHQRVQPHAMPNNSIAYLKGNRIDFKVSQQPNGAIDAFYKVDDRYDKNGSTAYQLIDTLSKEKFGYVSAYGHKETALVFDFHTVRQISHVDIYNYYNDESKESNKRGFKDVLWYTSQDGKTWHVLKKDVFKLSQSNEDKQRISLDTKTRYLKLACQTNYNDDTYQEGLFGLNRVAFFNQNHHYKDIDITADSVMIEEKQNAWIWLQDGVVIKDKLYFVPIYVNTDMDQPEGLQFRVVGAALYQTKIKNSQLDFKTIVSKRAPLMDRKGDSEWLMGAGIFSNTKQADALSPDGYIYVYGFKTTMGMRELIVARVKENRFDLFDDWQYYAAGKWVTELTDATPLVGHVSTELSVTELREGHNKGKYMVVFTYDTNTTKVAFSVGQTPWGPFSKPQVIYVTPEVNYFKSTTYTYNAKAHPHLSKSKSILVSYNTNTYSFDHNMSDYRIYHPRFISLKDTE